MKKLPLKLVTRIQIAIIIVGMLIGYLGVWLKLEGLMAIGIVLLIASVPFHLIFYRCPHCEAYLGRSSGKFCPECGKNLYPDQ